MDMELGAAEPLWGYGDLEVTGINWTFPSLLFLLDLGPVQMATARILPPTTGGGLSPCPGSTERSPSSGTDRQRDLRGRTRAYELGFVSSWICFFSSCTGMQPRRSADKEGDDVMAAYGRVTAELPSI